MSVFSFCASHTFLTRLEKSRPRFKGFGKKYLTVMLCSNVTICDKMLEHGCQDRAILPHPLYNVDLKNQNEFSCRSEKKKKPSRVDSVY